MVDATEIRGGRLRTLCDEVVLEEGRIIFGVDGGRWESLLWKELADIAVRGGRRRG
jgi:hypothetical protein